jgi:hypothetical protein
VLAAGAKDNRNQKKTGMGKSFHVLNDRQKCTHRKKQRPFLKWPLQFIDSYLNVRVNTRYFVSGWG